MNNYVVTIFFDFKKAFDTLNPGKIISALKRVGVHGKYLKWFENYFKKRKITVRIGREFGDLVDSDTGVPQGSVLGPILFNVYINDILKSDENAIRIAYADDKVIAIKGRDLENLLELAQAEIDEFVKWAHDKDLTINCGKTKYMICHTGHMLSESNKILQIHSCKCLKSNNRENCTCESVENVKVYRYLGIFIDSKLLWDEHISNLNKKLKIFLFQFSYLQNLIPTEVKKILYYGLVESSIRYGITAWGTASATKIKQLQKTQKRIIEKILPWKVVLELSGKNEIYQRAGILPLSVLNEYIIARNWDIFNHLLIHTPREELARSFRRYVVPAAKNRHGEQTMLHVVPTVYNKIPTKLLRSGNKFKLREHFLDNL
jgi:ribonucleases P/MRP protein subunit RPP40